MADVGSRKKVVDMQTVVEYGAGRTLPEAWAAACERNVVLESKVGYRTFSPLSGRPWRSSKVVEALSAVPVCAVGSDSGSNSLDRVREMFGLTGDRMVQLFHDPVGSWLALRVSGNEEVECRRLLDIGGVRGLEVWVFVGRVEVS